MSALTLIVALVLVLVATRLGAALARAVGQPAVIGEIAAGLLLGPTLLTGVWPALGTLAFTPATISLIGKIGDVGAVLFLFLLGAEFDLGALRQRPRVVVLASKLGMVLPVALGGLAAWSASRWLGAPLPPMTLAFIALASGMTALPVLARIVTERGLAGTVIGNQAIACAVLTDALSWALLAVLIFAWLPQHGGHGPFQFVVAAAYAALLFGPLRRRLATIAPALATGRVAALAEVLLYVAASATTSAWLGLHALLGAFAIGLLLPRNPQVVVELQRFLSPLCRWLLPCFFAAIGLSTDLGALLSGGLWWLAALMTAVAVIGKVGGCLLAGKLTLMPRHDAWMLGILMNTRGMMELVVLNLGRQLGLIAEPYFSAMLLMAIATTVMTSPWLQALDQKDSLAKA
ncbi:cation:proton antiporter [Jeongeupia naejangsanensis]|uniref:Cation:proton antiporter n=1 Tax=Jeongeupia naejangsanensis TaxID=613195 RepID=A0ABS2BP01_9NEIS|nr:cation:proton antiporter [Jeongeupia naejangsanensis]MBM3117140.1 cation:proton antiporter [Jeongeupia naejangsanensis]